MDLKLCRFSYLIAVIIFAIIASGGHQTLANNDDLPHYRMCVPLHAFYACKQMMANPAASDAVIECVPARDRMECLEKVNLREADFLAVDPEDMYVAFNMKNEDFAVFSDIRTVEESTAEFRYEGIILIRKNSNIHSLSDIRGKKSCHTGYGRNVGYKIPITKLKKHGILKISTDSSLSFVEKELKGLTELFTSSCLVGTYSPNEEVNQMLKKRYPQLCALCEDPVKCNYPDKFSGYDGAIRCLVENGGDVAFTKVIFVNRYFGLPVGNNPVTTEAKADPNDYEYLCEDGSRRPVTGKACSWAQRPWQGYMGNNDIRLRASPIQQRLTAFYNGGKQWANADEAKKMWINEKNVVVAKDEHVLPGDHLTKAQYKDVIERDGNMQQKIKFCVKNEIEHQKCEVLSKAAYSRDIRPEFECVTNTNCASAVHNKEADATVLPITEDHIAKANGLKAILTEVLDEHVYYVVAVQKGLSKAEVDKTPMTFDKSNARCVDAALFFNRERNIETCPNALNSATDDKVQIIESHKLKNIDQLELICEDLSRHPVEDAPTCNFNSKIRGSAVYVRSGEPNEEFNILHGFTTLSDKFGHGEKSIRDVFDLFGLFETGHENVIFGDDTGKLISTANMVNNVDDDVYRRVHCIKA